MCILVRRSKWSSAITRLTTIGHCIWVGDLFENRCYSWHSISSLSMRLGVIKQLKSVTDICIAWCTGHSDRCHLDTFLLIQKQRVETEWNSIKSGGSIKATSWNTTPACFEVNFQKVSTFKTSLPGNICLWQHWYFKDHQGFHCHLHISNMCKLHFWAYRDDLLACPLQAQTSCQNMYWVFVLWSQSSSLLSELTNTR